MSHSSHSDVVPRVVIKLGGSLLSQPRLGNRLSRLIQGHFPGHQVSLMVGGGQVIEALRQLDQVHRLDAAALHWLCIESLRTTFRIASLLLPQAQRIETVSEFADYQHSRSPGLHLIAIDSFFGPGNDDGLPEDWSTTSDAIAAVLAKRLNVAELCLLKSCDVTTDNLQAAAAQGIVDPVLPTLAERTQVRMLRLPDESFSENGTASLGRG